MRVGTEQRKGRTGRQNGWVLVSSILFCTVDSSPRPQPAREAEGWEELLFLGSCRF